MKHKVLFAFDLSTKPGYALYVNGNLYQYGTLYAQMVDKDFGHYPFNYLELSKHVVGRIKNEVIDPLLKEVKEKFPELSNEHWAVVAEETTSSKDGYAQKKLEFIHHDFLYLMKSYGVVPTYIRDGVWKSMVGARQTAEEKEINKKVKAYKEKTGEKLAKLDMGDGKPKVVGKKGQKDYSIRAVKEHFGISLMRKQEDSAEALLIGKCFLMLAEKNALVYGKGTCDGTKEGGLMSTLRVAGLL